MNVPGGKSLKFDVVVSIQIPGTKTMRKSLEVCEPYQFQIAVMPREGGQKWVFLENAWSTEAEPGNYVRRRLSDSKTPEGMVVGVVQPHQRGNEVAEVLILWFK